MSKPYSPRILVQGAFIVAPDGRIHSPRDRSLATTDHAELVRGFLFLNTWELTREGVRKAVDYARRHPLENDVISEWRFEILKDYCEMKPPNDRMFLLEKLGLDKKNPQAKRLGQYFWKELRALHPEKMDEILKQLIEVRLDDIANNTDRFIEGIKKQKPQLTPRWSDRTRAVMGKIVDATPPYAAAAAVGSAIVMAGDTARMFYNGSWNTMDLYVCAGAATTALGGVATIPAGYGLRKLAEAWRKRIKDTPVFDEKKAKALIAGMEGDIQKLPEKTQTLMAYYDPIIWVGDSNRYFLSHDKDYGGWGSGHHNQCFVRTGAIHVQEPRTTFEEVRHVHHVRLLNADPDWYTRMADAFMKELKDSKEAKDFFNKYGYKKEFWNHENYKEHPVRGAEAMVECDHMVWTMMKQGKTEEESIAEIAKYFPLTCVEYKYMLHLEADLLDELKMQEHQEAQDDAPGKKFVHETGGAKSSRERGGMNSKTDRLP